VKTKYGKQPKWILSRKADSEVAENLYYVFVAIVDSDAPDYYIVPRAVVAKYVREKHQTCLATPGRMGRVHRDSAMRVFRDREKRYQGRWDLLELGAVCPGR
jgi:hypothetical protein